MPRRVDGEAEARAQAQSAYLGNLYDYGCDILGDAGYWHEPLHRPLAEWMTRWAPGKYVKMLVIPREHGKSSWTANLVVHTFANHPDYRVLYAHGLIKLGIGACRSIKNKMAKPLARWLTPGVFWENTNDSPLWHQDQFALPHSEQHTPSFTLSSENSNTTGQHYNLIVLDDLVHKDNIGTKEMRDKTKAYFHGMIPQLLPGGKVLVLGTRWHHDDLYGYLMSEENHYHQVLDPYVLDCGYPDAPIFPPSPNGKLGFTLEMLEERKGGMNPYAWSCQYMNNPTPVETQYFRRADIHIYDFYPDGSIPNEGKAVRIFTAVDPNRSEKEQHDPAVVMTAAIDEDGHYWVLDISRGHPSGPELVDWIRTHAIRWKPEKVIVEANNFQMQLQSWLKEDMVKTGYAYPLDMVQRGPTTKKHERITAMQQMVAQQRLHIRRGFDNMVTEMEFFPAYKNDDQCDALSDIFHYGSKPKKTTIEERRAPKTGYLLNQMVDDMLEDQRAGVQRVVIPGHGVRRAYRVG